MQENRRGNWMQTYTGRAYWPADPRSEEVCIEDIAHHLSMLCRYTGAVKKFYSVAEHSVLISHAVPPEHAFIGLMHDAQEAYVQDIGRPLKRSLTNYAEIEEANWRAIADRFQLPYTLPPIVKEMDGRICMDEKLALMAPHPADWDADLGQAIGVGVCAMPPEEAEKAFLNRFWELYHAHLDKASGKAA